MKRTVPYPQIDSEETVLTVPFFAISLCLNRMVLLFFYLPVIREAILNLHLKIYKYQNKKRVFVFEEVRLSKGAWRTTDGKETRESPQNGLSF